MRELAAPEIVQRHRLLVTGVVQGVGFRPFVYRLARLHGLSGWVCNTSTGVEIEVEGAPAALAAFTGQLSSEAPALARVDSVAAQEAKPAYQEGFAILESRWLADTEALIPADVATCGECLAETADPKDPRYGYPFTNCTNCGPRFTIVRQVPYDRPHTTMASFEMCRSCRAEYQDPENRRFHAEPIACPACGPQAWLEGPDGVRGYVGTNLAALKAAGTLLLAGQIVAVKGLGGFHLAADARLDEAVRLLRRRKGRVAKPFAVMVANLAEAEKLCRLGDQEKELLLSRERPIVLALRREDCGLSPQVAPGNRYLGLLLPYTPLHQLLFAYGPPALVMTSGNLSEEPLVFTNEEAHTKLSALADAFLMHNRDIQVPCDDSVLRPAGGHQVIPLRRARGFVPNPVAIPVDSEAILGVGAEQKNTFCLAQGGAAWLSQHIGDLDTVETFDYYQLAISHFKALCRKDPAVVAHDLHPHYFSTRYAQGLPDVRLIGVQHHHAHVAACLAENQRPGPCIGVALDGTGYGPDRTVWGGEILVADLAGFTRVGHLARIRLPGGDAAVRDPRRLSAAYLHGVYGDNFAKFAKRLELNFTPLELDVLRRQLAGDLNAPLTSSAGRLFDAVAGALNVCRVRTYEGQPALELEMAADESEDAFYPAPIQVEPETLVLDTFAIFRRVVEDHQQGVEVPKIAARFHNSLVRLLAAACELVREQTGLETVALSGGVFQNALLLVRLQEQLTLRGFEVLSHRETPPNDGSISLGQVAVAAARLKREGEKAKG
jgi:hydrogenase maturation protein HypF